MQHEPDSQDFGSADLTLPDAQQAHLQSPHLQRPVSQQQLPSEQQPLSKQQLGHPQSLATVLLSPLELANTMVRPPTKTKPAIAKKKLFIVCVPSVEDENEQTQINLDAINTLALGRSTIPSLQYREDLTDPPIRQISRWRESPFGGGDFQSRTMKYPGNKFELLQCEFELLIRWDRQRGCDPWADASTSLAIATTIAVRTSGMAGFWIARS